MRDKQNTARDKCKTKTENVKTKIVVVSTSIHQSRLPVLATEMGRGYGKDKKTGERTKTNKS